MLDLNPRIVTLGTAGGPRWWPGRDGGRPARLGISTAVVVGEAVYLVDAGRGAGGQYAHAGLDPHALRAVFLTHLHSDHVVDLPNLLLFGWMMTDHREKPVRIIGPGDRGALPPTNPRAGSVVAPLFEDAPAVGTTAMVEHLLKAYSADTSDRIFDSLRRSPYGVFAPEDIRIPGGTGYEPNENPTPEGMEPFEVYRDELVTVTATLVRHPPVAPAFAFRFDTAEGSVTVSGDTAPCQNLTVLASGTDLLLHEAIDFAWAQDAYAGADPQTRAATLEHHRKSHTSPADAGRIAASAGARVLALHHLVPGHGDAFHGAEAAFPGPVLIPEDLEVISFARRPSALTALSTR